MEMAKGELNILPEEYPEVLTSSSNVENLLPKIGDKMILTWFKKHHPYGHLIGALKNSSYTDRVRCCLFIPDCKSNNLFLFCRPFAGSQTISAKQSNDKNQKVKKTQKTRQKESTSVINSQLHTLKNHFKKEGTLSNVTVLCFLCIGEKEDEHADERLEKIFVDVRKSVYKKDDRKIVFKDLQYQRVNFCDQTEEFTQESSLKIKELISTAEINAEQNHFMEKLTPFIADSYQIAFRNETLKFKEFQSETIALNLTGIRSFIQKYLSKRANQLVTLPDFDRIRLTKLYPTITTKSNQSVEKVPQDLKNSPMTENGGLFSYIGEIETFWPHFCKLWFPEPKGVLMHSFCQKTLSSLVRDKLKLDFEFDWIFWTENHVILFEVGMKETDDEGKISDEKISENIREKLNKAFEQYFPVFKILFYYLTESWLKQEQFEQFFEQCFSIVIFFPSIDHSIFGERVGQYIRARSENGDFKDVEIRVLSNVYFVGKSSVKHRNNICFYKYDTATTQINNVQTSATITNPEISETNKEVIDYVMGLISLSYFCTNHSEVVGNFQEGPGSLLERFIEMQMKFIEKAYNLRSEKKTMLKLDVLLSPQQFGILLEGKRFMRCDGESGSGKTELLLAKALISSLDDDVKKIYFCVPQETSSDTPLMNLIASYKSNKSIEKMQVLLGKEVYPELSKLQHDELKHTVVLLDEFQDRYRTFIAVTNQEFFDLSQKIFPYVKCCWIVSATLKWHFGMTKNFSNYFIYERFAMRSMNTTFRSSTHIAEFCNKLVHIQYDLRFSNSRVKGVFTSKQTTVEIHEFPEDLIERIGGIYGSNESLAERTPRLKQVVNAPLDSSYDESRWLIVFCAVQDRDKWTAKLEEMYKISTSVKRPQIFVINAEHGPAGCSFSGGEADSVIVYFDEHIISEATIENSPTYDMILMASSRARYELVIYVRDDLKAIINTLRNFSQSIINQPRNIDRTLKMLSEKTKNGKFKHPKLMGDELMPYILDTIEDRALSSSFIEKVKDVTGVEQVPEFLEGTENRDILLSCGRNIGCCFLTALLKIRELQRIDSLKNGIRWCNRVGKTNLVQWLINLIEVKKLQEAVDAAAILKFAAFSPGLMELWLPKLNQWQKLNEGLECKLHLECGDEGVDCGLITLLTFTNFDFTDKEKPWYNDLQALISKTRVEYLLGKLFNESALYYAKQHGNSKSIDYISNKPEWKDYL